MRKTKTLFGAGSSRAKRVRAVPLPYTLRVTRDHGGGLWTLEDDKGQTYLAVLGPKTTAHRRATAAQRSPTWSSEEEKSLRDAG